MSNPLRVLLWILLGVLTSSGCAAPARLDPAPSRAALVPTSAAAETMSQVSGESQAETMDTAAMLVRDAALRKGVSPEEAEDYHDLVQGVDPRFKGLMTSLVYANLNRNAPDEAHGGVEPIQASPATTSATERDRAPSETRAATTTPTAKSAVLSATGAYHARLDDRDDPESESPAVDLAAPAVDQAAPAGRSSRRTERGTDSRRQPASDKRQVADDTRNQDDQHAASPPEASPAQDVPGSWRRQLREAIGSLQKQLEFEQGDGEERARLQARLSLLCLVAEDLETSMQVLDGLDDQQLEFWRQSMMGLGILLSSDDQPKFRHRVDTASSHLSQGISSLASLGPLRLSNLTFCTKVNGFGDVVACDPYSLRPGDPVLLYVEVENFTVEEIERNAASDRRTFGTSRRNTEPDHRDLIYETELLGRYEIFDVDQRQVVSRTLPISRDTCRNHRRDYFIPYTIYLPDQIVPGSYTLELTIEDKKGEKFGNAVIDFRIR